MNIPDSSSESFMKKLCDGAIEDSPIRFGNVDFWIDNGELCYSPSKAQWDAEMVRRDIVKRAYAIGLR